MILWDLRSDLWSALLWRFDPRLLIDDVLVIVSYFNRITHYIMNILSFIFSDLWTLLSTPVEVEVVVPLVPLHAFSCCLSLIDAKVSGNVYSATQYAFYIKAPLMCYG